MQPVSIDEGETTGAVVAESAPARQSQEHLRAGRFDVLPPALVSVLTVIAVLLHGYHPYAEDGGIYLPGILKLLHPELYPAWTGFVTAQSQFSLFPILVEGVVRSSGASVMSCVLAIYLASIWITLYAAWQLLVRCCRSRFACIAGVSILALCLTIPIAGTSLIMLDPYVTARSISTPCGLLALVGAVDLIASFRRTGQIRPTSAALCGLSLLLAACMHPLMAAYAGGCIVLLACTSFESSKAKIMAMGLVAAFAVTVAAIICRFAPSRPQGYGTAAITRYYWFLSQWQWYEITGLIAPLLLLFTLSRYKHFNECARWLAHMSISAGLIGLAVSLLFARGSARSYSIAMLQPLRVFLIIYIVMILLGGAVLADVFLKREFLRWATVFLPLAALIFFVQMRIYPHSSHLEFPWAKPGNDWERGFLWIRNNTPADVTVALDAKYILIDGEDTQNFRAIAERSSPPDYQKDGGIAAIEPSLTAEWIAGQAIQDNLANSSDGERRSRLARAGIEWLVLPEDSITSFACPYQNSSMKVCRVPDR